ncbi:protein SENSITIVE TO UV 2 isoform X2 [Phragmites australis]|uniref:protein SENSITIVE TO UV 2 isoform X2 n=1 Tax=Phragmites australis TaxID=29695 RepID=UPI002D79A1ED|nr:protein SENSITIVE TO UV 2 isoform X2 [Phragmites australis]
MDGGLDGEWEDESFLEELFRAQDEAVASHNPNPTPTPTPAPAPVTHDPAAAAPISYLPAATSYPSPALRFSPPRELTQRPPLPLPPAAASYDEAMAMVGRDFSPPRELSQRPAVEDSDCAIVVVSGPAGGDRFMSTGGGVGAKRGREAREVERLKRELNRVSKQMNDLKNECTELRKDRTRKDLQIKAKEAEIQNLKKANFEHLDYKKVLVERISSNLRAIWGMPTNSLSGRNLISKIIVSCSEEILALLQCTRLTDECGTSSEARSSMDEAISEVYDMFIKMSSEKIPIQTFLEALLNLCSFDNAAIVGRTLRILHRVLQPLLNYGTKSNGRNNVSVEPYVNMHMENNRNDSSTLLTTPDAENLLRRHNMSLPFTFWSSVFTQMLQIGAKHSEESIRVDALSIMILIVRTTDPIEERQKFAFTSVMERLHRLLQKENGSLVKKHSVRLLFLLLNCPAILKLLCSGGKDGSEQMESEGIKNDRSKQAVSSVLEDLSECLTCEATCSLGIELCRLVIILLAYIASSGKLGYEVLLGPVTARGTNFLELIMEVLASQMHYETLELLKERCLLMREALILLNRLASHANFSKPTLEVLTSSKLCATLTIDVANRLPQTQMANDLAELAQKFRLRVYGFLEEKPLTADGSNPNASRKISNFQEQQNSSVDRSIPR